MSRGACRLALASTRDSGVNSPPTSSHDSRPRSGLRKATSSRPGPLGCHDGRKGPGPAGNGWWTQEIYYHLLNAGLRLPPSAGSASGVLPNPVGHNRVYVGLGAGKLSYSAWLEGLRKGHCFVTNGPLLLASGLSVVLGVYSFFLPHTPPKASAEGGVPFIKALALFLAPPLATPMRPGIHDRKFPRRP